MAGEDRADTDPVALLERIAREPHKWDLFQALRRIENAYRDRPRLGKSLHPETDPVRLAQEPTTAFAFGALQALDRTRTTAPRLVTMLGMLGSNGPLPLHITEYIRERIRNERDPTMARFLDLFHHRMLSLFFRAYADARPANQADRPGEDRFAFYLGALVGLTVASGAMDGVPDVVRRHHAGHLVPHARNAEGLASMLGDWFETPVRIESFVGEWAPLPTGSQWRLGGNGLGLPLGRGTALGARAWLRQSRFRIVMGPMPVSRYRELLPGTERRARLGALVRGYVGDAFTWDVRLEIDRDRAPWRLGGAREEGGGHLGWTTWL